MGTSVFQAHTRPPLRVMCPLGLAGLLQGHGEGPMAAGSCLSVCTSAFFSGCAEGVITSAFAETAHRAVKNNRTIEGVM